MISERRLRRWRGEALKDVVSPEVLATYNGVDEEFHKAEVLELSNRILILTAELLDQHLLRKMEVKK